MPLARPRLLVALPLLCALAVLAFAPPVGAAAGAGVQLAPAFELPPPERFPVLVYDVSGSTLSGPVQVHLAAYSDGVVSYSRSAFLGPTGGEPSQRVEQVEVGVEAVQELWLDLLHLGIRRFRGGVGPGLVADVPLTTVTYFPPHRRWKLRKEAPSEPGFGPISVANTFTYYLAPPELALVQQRIFEFVELLDSSRR